MKNGFFRPRAWAQQGGLPDGFPGGGDGAGVVLVGVTLLWCSPGVGVSVVLPWLVLRRGPCNAVRFLVPPPPSNRSAPFGTGVCVEWCWCGCDVVGVVNAGLAWCGWGVVVGVVGALGLLGVVCGMGLVGLVGFAGLAGFL